MYSQNRNILDKAVNSMNDWDNADGFNMDDAFSMDDADAGVQQQSVARPQVSMPYIFTVTSTSLVTETVVLYGSEKNRTATNFGNTPVVIQVTYDFSGYFGGGTTGYGALLARTESTPLIFGRIRIECTNPTQLSAPLNASDFDPTGKAVTYPIVNFRKLNQFDQNAVETETDLTVYGGTEVSYNQLAGTTVRWFFYAADVASLKRGLGGHGVVKELRRPDTYLQETVKLQAPAGKRLGLM